MRLPLLLLCSLFALTFAGVASLDFAATRPDCYNHQTGGGSFNDASNPYVVESLQGGSFACGDVVSFLWYVVVDNDNTIADNSYMEFHLQFTGTTTGQEGVGFSQVRGNKVYINKYGVGYVHGAGCRYDQTGCTLTTDNCNKATATSYDSGVLSKGTAEDAVLVRQWFSGAPPFVSGSTLNVALRISGVTKQDRIVIRIDVEIACDPYATRTPSGNIQGLYYDGWLGTTLAPASTKPAYLTDRATADISNVWAREGSNHVQDVVRSRTVNSGSQTVPLKSVEDIKPCAEVEQMKCIDFVADMRVTTESGEGFSYGKFNYCWTNGKMSWKYGTADNSYSGTSSIRTFDVACTSNHLSLYDTSVGVCGTCELVQQFPTSLQPQLCYNASSSFWQPNPVTEPLTVIPLTGSPATVQTLHYTANISSVQGTGVTDLWLRATDSMPIQIRFNDGKVFTFYNQVVGTDTACASALYTPATCTSFLCGRPLDLAIVQELSKNTDLADQQASRALINSLIQKFVFGPTNVQVGYITYNNVATTRLALSAGTSKANVGSAVNATGCPSNVCTGNGMPSVGITAGTAMLAASTRSTAVASRVILMIVNEIEEPIANIEAAVAAAATKGVYVICVAYNSGTPADFFYAITSDPGTYGSRTQNLFYVPQVADLSNSLTVTSVATRLCGLVSYSASCTTCCESLLCNTAGTLCGGSPCSNQIVSCPPYYADDGVTPHCALEYVVDSVTGCCKEQFRSNNPCPTANNASCYSQTCNIQTGQCQVTPGGGCADPDTTDCKNRQCSSTAPYTCIDVPIPQSTAPPQPAGCNELQCVDNAWVWVDIGCTAVDDLCQTRQCNPTTRQCEITPKPDPAPSTNKCVPRICVDGLWQDGPAKTCPSPGSCVNSVCDPDTGSCVNTNVICGDPANLCSTTTCVGEPNAYTCEGAVPVVKTCTPEPCYTVSQCVPGSGQCVSSSPISCPFDANTGCTRKCNVSDNTCINNTCPPPPPVGCTAVCTNTACETYKCEIVGGISICAGPTVRDCTKELDPQNSCQINDGCSNTANPPGCQIRTRNCTQELEDGLIVIPPGVGKCGYVIQDPTNPNCCVVQTKTCPNNDPCAPVICDTTDGVCKSGPSRCVTTDPCFPVLCTPTGCQETTLCATGVDAATCATRSCTPNFETMTATCGTDVTTGCSTNDKCKVGKCNSATKQCEFSPLCSNATNDLCTLTFCNATGGFCYDVPVATGVTSGCKLSGCDPATGPFSTLDNSKCQDGNPCFLSVCQEDGTCSRTPYNCTGKLANQSFCKPVICRDFIGCQLIDLDCFTDTEVRPTNGSCEVVECVDCDADDDNRACIPHSKPYTGYCKVSGGACFPLFALIGGLAGGVVAAIVICGLIALALVGGGVGAAARATQTPDDHAVFNNPLFKEKGLSGRSPW